MASNKLLLGTLSCLVLASCASAQRADDAVPAEAHDKNTSARVVAQIDTLEQLSVKSKLACANLKTWEGEIRVDDIEYFFGDRRDKFIEDHIFGAVHAPAEFRKEVTAIVTFSLDAENNSLHSRFETESVEIVDPTKGATLGIDLLPFNQDSIITSESYIYFQPNIHYAQPEGKRMRVAFCDGPEKAREQVWGAIIDPRLLLGYGRPTWENLDLLIRALRQNGEFEVEGARLEVVSSGVKFKVTLDAVSPQISRDDAAPLNDSETFVSMPGLIGPGRLLFQDMRFVDDNLVSLTIREDNGEVHQSLHWTYMEQNGVDVPSGLTYRAIGSEEQRITFQRQLSVLASKPNAEIAPAVFERSNIGLRDGDHFVDRVVGTVSRMDNGELRPLPVEQSREWLAPS